MSPIPEVSYSSIHQSTFVLFEYLVWKDLLADDIPHSTNHNHSLLTPEMNIEHMLHTSDKDSSPPMKEEILGNSSPTSLELIPPSSIPSSPPDNRRTSIRQQKRRIFPTPKDSPNVLKKRLRLDFDNNSNFNLDSIPHSDHSSIFNEQQSIESKAIDEKIDDNKNNFSSFVDKRCRTVGKRSAKRTGRFSVRTFSLLTYIVY